MHKYNNICCSHCFSSSFNLYGKDFKGKQKFLCLFCFSQFTLKSRSSRISFKGYPLYPICSRNTFLWYKYSTHLHLNVILNNPVIVLKFLCFLLTISLNSYPLSIYKWIIHFYTFFQSVFNYFLSNANLFSDYWHADETFLKVKAVEQSFHLIYLVHEMKMLVRKFLSK